MISSPQPSECYVYITLPGETLPVTAGRFTLTTDSVGNPLGGFQSRLNTTEANQPVASAIIAVASP
jgi:hypothetical protein